MIHADLLLSTLERFPGYTLSTLLDESEDLIRLINIRERGRPTPHGQQD